MKILELNKKKKPGKKNWVLILSVFLNLVILISFTLFVFKGNNFSRLLKEFSSTKEEKTNFYLEEWYKELTDIFSMYSDQKNIVMLGDSHIAAVNWAELLNRCDVATRGIYTDITRGFIHRIKYVLDLQPKICFIEGGINDLHLGISNEIIIDNLQTLIDTLQVNSVKVVLTTVPLVTQKRNNKVPVNDKVKLLNVLIFQLSEKNNIPVIDLNKILSDGANLKDDASSDGVHLRATSYLEWKKMVIDVLNQEQLFY